MKERGKSTTVLSILWSAIRIYTHTPPKQASQLSYCSLAHVQGLSDRPRKLHRVFEFSKMRQHGDSVAGGEASVASSAPYLTPSRTTYQTCIRRYYIHRSSMQKAKGGGLLFPTCADCLLLDGQTWGRWLGGCLADPRLNSLHLVCRTSVESSNAVTQDQRR